MWPSSTAAAARGDAVQAAFDRKLSHYTNEIVELRQQDIQFRPLVWTAYGRPQPAADIASSRNDQQMSAESLQRRWKQEIQIALLRWGEKPWHEQFCLIRRHEQNGSSLVSLIEPCITVDMAPLFDGGPGDHDHADSETDTAIPDDDDDITSHQVFTRLVSPPPFGAVCVWPAMVFPGDFANQSVPRSPVPPFDLVLQNILEDHEVSWQIIGEMLAVELETYRRCSQRNRLSLSNAEVR